MIELALGEWQFTAPSRQGGRPKREFVLRLRTKPTRLPDEDAVGQLLNRAMDISLHARPLLRDIVALIQQHRTADAQLNVGEIDAVMAALRQALTPLLGAHYRPARTPIRASM